MTQPRCGWTIILGTGPNVADAATLGWRTQPLCGFKSFVAAMKVQQATRLLGPIFESSYEHSADADQQQAGSLLYFADNHLPT
jgi:hypothetical protein